MSKIVISQKIRDKDGKPFGERVDCLVVDVEGNFVQNKEGNFMVVTKDKEDEKKTLKQVIITSMLYEAPKEVLTGEQKHKNYQIYKKVDKAKDIIELDAKEVTAIKDRIGASQKTIVTGQCYEMMEGQIIDPDLDKKGKLTRKAKEELAVREEEKAKSSTE